MTNSIKPKTRDGGMLHANHYCDGARQQSCRPAPHVRTTAEATSETDGGAAAGTEKSPHGGGTLRARAKVRPPPGVRSCVQGAAPTETYTLSLHDALPI